MHIYIYLYIHMYAYAVYRAIVVILEFILSHGIPAGAFPQEPPAAGCASKRRLEAAFCPKARTKDISVPRTWCFFSEIGPLQRHMNYVFSYVFIYGFGVCLVRYGLM